MFRNCEIVAQSSGNLKGPAGNTSTSPLFYEVILSWTLFDQNMPISVMRAENQGTQRKTLESDQGPCRRFETTLSGYSEICHFQLNESRYFA